MVFFRFLEIVAIYSCAVSAVLLFAQYSEGVPYGKTLSVVPIITVIGAVFCHFAYRAVLEHYHERQAYLIRNRIHTEYELLPRECYLRGEKMILTAEKIKPYFRWVGGSLIVWGFISGGISVLFGAAILFSNQAMDWLIEAYCGRKVRRKARQL